MFNKHFSFGRVAALASLVLFLSLGFASCQREAEYPGYVQVGDVKAYDLKADDPICGEWNGNAGNFWIYPNFVFNQSVASTSEDTESAEPFKSLSLSSWYQDQDGTWKETIQTYKFANDSAPIYVVYKDENDKKSGVLIFKAKYSAWGIPTIGSYYGIKFKIDKDDSSKILIEGGYNSATEYNNVTDLTAAVEKFAFDNDDFYNPAYWNESASGATKK